MSMEAGYNYYSNAVIALVKVMPHCPPTGGGGRWGLDLKLLPYLGDLDRSPDACIGSNVNLRSISIKTRGTHGARSSLSPFAWLIRHLNLCEDVCNDRHIRKLGLCIQ